MKKTRRQLAVWVSTPPSTGPEAAAIPLTAPQTPTARARAPGSSYAAPSRASEDGTRTAAAVPWTSRATMREPVPGASPHAAEATTNTPRPAAKVRWAPKRSPSDPADSSSAANVSV